MMKFLAFKFLVKAYLGSRLPQPAQSRLAARSRGVAPMPLDIDLPPPAQGLSQHRPKLVLRYEVQYSTVLRPWLQRPYPCNVFVYKLQRRIAQSLNRSPIHPSPDSQSTRPVLLPRPPTYRNHCAHLAPIICTLFCQI